MSHANPPAGVVRPVEPPTPGIDLTSFAPPISRQIEAGLGHLRACRGRAARSIITEVIEIARAARRREPNASYLEVEGKLAAPIFDGMTDSERRAVTEFLDEMGHDRTSGWQSPRDRLWTFAVRCVDGVWVWFPEPPEPRPTAGPDFLPTASEEAEAADLLNDEPDDHDQTMTFPGHGENAREITFEEAVEGAGVDFARNCR